MQQILYKKSPSFLLIFTLTATWFLSFSPMVHAKGSRFQVIPKTDVRGFITKELFRSKEMRAIAKDPNSFISKTKDYT